MNLLPMELKKECARLINENPDIPELQHPLINYSDVIRAHFILVHYFSDSSSEDEIEAMLPGIRGGGGPLLGSALGRQVVSFDGHMKYERALDICATLFFGLVKNHSFVDGNKRTALLILLYQLWLYGYFPTERKEEFEDLVLQVADDSIVQYNSENMDYSDFAVKYISEQLRGMVQRRNSSYNISPTMREFCDALENLGVHYRLNKSKITFSYDGPATLSTSGYTISFGGWTRVVGPRKARDTLNYLGLFDQFSSYQDFLHGSEPLYELTDNFHEPLKRLKDK